jgi:hypothetical protein
MPFKTSTRTLIIVRMFDVLAVLVFSVVAADAAAATVVVAADTAAIHQPMDFQ